MDFPFTRIKGGDVAAAIITTDAHMPTKCLRKAVLECAEESYNRITIDIDMPTNNTVLVMANGASGIPPIRHNGHSRRQFREALCWLMLELAKAVVRNGERVTRFATVHVKGVRTYLDAKKVAKAVCKSALAKSSWNGGGPNWGRIIHAVGYSRARIRRELIDVYVGGLQAGTPMDDLRAVVAEPGFGISISLNQGDADYTTYPNDLSPEHVDFNRAEYAYWKQARKGGLVCLLACVLVWASPRVNAAIDIWDMPPLRYSDTSATDPLAVLAAGAPPGMVPSEARTPLERLRFVLKLLEVPEESQVLVFSKTSKQNALIHPGNPRCLFFNENSYVGYVPGGDIEVITHDPVLGAVFYLIGGGNEAQTLRISRDTSQCLSCHGTARTESVPGVLVRSVFPDASGQPLFSQGSFLIDHSSPVRERWGGYYVTGRSALPHLGNRTFEETPDRVFPETAIQLASVEGRIDTSRYLRPTSDIVALMVLEHQCHVYNTMAAAGVNYRRMVWLQQSLDPAADPDQGSAGRFADEAAARIVNLLLFENEAELGEDGIDGDPAFQDAFLRRFPKAKDGRSLADFQLQDHLFKHRCSYMIYSEAFRSLPERVRTAVIRQLHGILTTVPSPESYPGLKTGSRRRIAAILHDTLPGWPGGSAD